MDGEPLLRIVVAKLETRIADVTTGAQPPLRRALCLARDAAQDPVFNALQRRLCRATLARLEQAEGALAELAWAIRALAGGQLEEVAQALLDDGCSRRTVAALAGTRQSRCA